MFGNHQGGCSQVNLANSRAQKAIPIGRQGPTLRISHKIPCRWVLHLSWFCLRDWFTRGRLDREHKLACLYARLYLPETRVRLLLSWNYASLSSKFAKRGLTAGFMHPDFPLGRKHFTSTLRVAHFTSIQRPMALLLHWPLTARYSLLALPHGIDPLFSRPSTSLSSRTLHNLLNPASIFHFFLQLTTSTYNIYHLSTITSLSITLCLLTSSVSASTTTATSPYLEHLYLPSTGFEFIVLDYQSLEYYNLTH